MNAEPPRSLAPYEAQDGSVRTIALTAFTLVLCVAVSLAAARLIYTTHYARTPAPRSLGSEGEFQSAPEAATAVEKSWRDQDAAVRAHLAGYGWIDRAKGVVCVPIDRAEDILLAEQQKGRASRAASPSAP